MCEDKLILRLCCDWILRVNLYSVNTFVYKKELSNDGTGTSENARRSG